MTVIATLSASFANPAQYTPTGHEEGNRRKRRRSDGSAYESSTDREGPGDVSEGVEENDNVDDIDDKASGTLTRGSHPYGVKPQGNSFSDYEKGVRPIRDRGLGLLQVLNDSQVLELLDLLSVRDLGILASVSKSFYVFVHHEEQWKARVLMDYDGRFSFEMTWRGTYATMLHRARGKKCFLYKHSPIEVKGFYSDLLFQPFWCASAPLHPSWVADVQNVDRRSNLSLEDFRREYEEPNKPVIITDVVGRWPAFSRWSKEYLISKAGDAVFSAGGFRMTLRDYFHYAEQCAADDQPLYIFDKKFASSVPQFAEDYSVPIYFEEDFFQVLGDNRPDYRWIIIGPAKSGSSFHQDPNSTSAWNAVIKGAKKWILYPPDIVPPGVHPSKDGADVATPVSLVEWFLGFYHHTRNTPVKPLECVVKEGELIFVPRGWWHAVINLEDSLAITQNYVSSANLTHVLKFLETRVPQISGLCDERFKAEMYKEFKTALMEKRPECRSIIEEYEKEALKSIGRGKTMWEAIKEEESGDDKGTEGFSFNFDVGNC